MHGCTRVKLQVLTASNKLRSISTDAQIRCRLGADHDSQMSRLVRANTRADVDAASVVISEARWHNRLLPLDLEGIREEVEVDAAVILVLDVRHVGDEGLALHHA